MLRGRALGWLLAAGVAATPACLDHYVLHPEKDPLNVSAWDEEVVRGALRIRLEWVRPQGDGPFPVILIHPEAGKEARQMSGILRSLALEGYLAVAADYYRLPDGERKGSSLFAWSEPGDATAVLDLVRARPDVDAQRIGAMGYSQGGVYSLLIAAHSPDVRAVVAYYPVTDFEAWLSNPDYPWGKRQFFKLVRRHFRKHSGAQTDEEFTQALAEASALHQAEDIHAPVLLIHGDRDTSADIGESRRLATRLRELGRRVKLMEVGDAGHAFNFRDADKARGAWEAAMAWLDLHVKESR
jgi:dienelactone hydrolase